MPIVKCQICFGEFYVKPNRLLRGWGKYCSKACNYQAQKTGTKFKCHVCSKEVYRNVATQTRSESQKYFCSKSCQTVWRNRDVYTREKHANWKSGESSYRAFMRRTSKNKLCAKCNTVDTRVLAVHHKDRNRQNNDVSNLIWLCHNCHYLVHHHGEEGTGFIL
jgi:hypothetical protein